MLSRRHRAAALAWCLMVVVSLLQAPAPVRAAHPDARPAPGAPWEPLPLSAYPRPRNDNGRGVHWAPTTFSQPREIVDYLVDELGRLNVRWVKLLLPATHQSVAHEYLLRRLQEEGIMPVARLYPVRNEPLPHLEEIVRQYVRLGVYYYEVYSDVNLRGPTGGWTEGEDICVDKIVDLWLRAADQVRAAGGYPGLPTLTAGGDRDDLEFLRDMLAEIARRGRPGALRGVWLPVHNAFLNHPPEYPYDDVNLYGTPVSTEEIDRWALTPAEIEALNAARVRGRSAQVASGYFDADELLDVDSNGFLKFEAYRRAFVEIFGFEIPIISVAGGAVVGDRQDPRYPAVTERDLAEWTLYAYEYMLDSAPESYFAFMPWLLVNGAAGGPSPHHERAAWYRDLRGTVRPVVSALRDHARWGETRASTDSVRAQRAEAQLAARGVATGAAGDDLVNGGFEGSYVTHGEGDVLVAEGWQPWWRQGTGVERSGGLLHRPAFAPVRDIHSAARVRSGSTAQGLSTNYATHEAGLYQQIRVGSGSRVEFTAWAYIWSSSDDDLSRSSRPGAYEVSVGIDPSGGTDAGSPAVVWSEPVRRYDRWLRLAVSATAEADVVTVYTRGVAGWRVKHNESYWDDAALRVVAADGGSSLSQPSSCGDRQAASVTAWDASGAPLAVATAPYATFSNGQVGITWRREQNAVTVTIRGIVTLDGVLDVWHDGELLARRQVRLLAGEPFTLTWEHPSVGMGMLGVRVSGSHGVPEARLGVVGGDHG